MEKNEAQQRIENMIRKAEEALAGPFAEAERIERIRRMEEKMDAVLSAAVELERAPEG